MEVVYGSLEKSRLEGGIACALGFFDGIHIGHQKLLGVLKDISDMHKLKTMVFTFEKHPLNVISRGKAPKLIMDNDTKTRIFEGLGIDILNYNNVDPEFLGIEPENFLKNILMEKFNIRFVVTGFNFTFGFKGRGNSSLLTSIGANIGLGASIVEPVCMDGMVVSSTAIRSFISKGNIKMANKFLGRCYSLSGQVAHGMRRGHGLGFPTANISIGSDLVSPKNGVYITRVFIDGMIKTGVTNVGYNPTFGNDYVSVETHIVDFNECIYGRNIKIDFYDRLRDEVAFGSTSELSAQIYHDKLAAIKYFKQNP